MSTVTLGRDQQRVYDRALEGENLLVTGAAGTGKSFTIGEIIRGLRQAGKSVAITASTGIAGLNVGGCTIHSFLGTGIKGTVGALRKRMPDVLENKKLDKRLRRTDVLIIDEVSMLSGDYLDMVDFWLTWVRKDFWKYEAHEEGDAFAKAPAFGGMQVILVGDFLQLPPVLKYDTPRPFAFQAAAWERGKVQTELLQEVFRQSDATFAEHLNRLRVGDLTPQAEDFFAACVGRELEHPTFLVPHNASALRYNLDALERLPGDVAKYEATLEGKSWAFDALAKDCIAERELKLKVGAQVIFLCNDSERRIVNGMRGEVTRCEPGHIWVKRSTGGEVSLDRHRWERKDGDGATVASMKQFPVKLAYALTIHKSQGMTLDRVRCNLERAFTGGHAYVALSRATSAEGLSLDVSLTHDQVMVAPEAVEFYERTFAG
jgi:ATP-dependent exoDNAse (exonuclease V) alpha subunit